MEKGFFTAEWFPYQHERFENSDKVAAMSLTEEGAYHRAIRLAWKFRDLPADPDILAARIQKRCNRKTAEKILKCFVPSPDKSGKVVHPVVEEIRQEQEKKYLNRVKGGKLAHRKHDKEKTSSITPAELELSSSITPAHNRDLKNREYLKRLIDACARENPMIDRKLVEIGVLYTLLQRNGSDEPISSLKYFGPEIGKAATSGMKDKAVDAMLERRRQQWFGEEGK